VNSELTMLYWRIGQRIHTQVLEGRRADYGEEVVSTLAAQLVKEYGGSFAVKNLRRMVQFAATFPDEQNCRITDTTIELDALHRPDPAERPAPAGLLRADGERRTLERADAARAHRLDAVRAHGAVQKPGETIAQELATMRDAQRMSPALVMRDPYILDFLGLRDTGRKATWRRRSSAKWSRSCWSWARAFQLRGPAEAHPIDDEDFHLDLLFYNRKLRRLVAVELKVGEFKAAYKGQMELYLRWLDKHEREPEEASPLGIILCTGKKREQIELLELDKSGIHVAEYLTALPPRGVLVERLQQATQRAQLQIEQRKTRQRVVLSGSSSRASRRAAVVVHTGS
jgi:predicted nuclease of restriction endonuclease-like (RecB) superfamily